ncbi:MAG: HdeD family acid-resistance protein [Endomicrobiales bacterium]
MIRETKQDTAVIVEEELRRINAPMLRQEVRGLSGSMMAMGVIEMIAGVLAISLPFFAGALFVVLLGTAVVISGIMQIVHSFSRRSTGLFIMGLIVAAAGALIIAHPLFGLAFLTLLVGGYLIASGIVRLSVSRGRGWDIAAGVIGVIAGILVLAGWPSSSAVVLGLLVGITILTSGIATFTMGSRLNKAAQEPQRPVV